MTPQYPNPDDLFRYRDEQRALLYAFRITRTQFQRRVHRACKRFNAEVDRVRTLELIVWIRENGDQWFGREDPTPRAIKNQKRLIQLLFPQFDITPEEVFQYVWLNQHRLRKEQTSQ